VFLEKRELNRKRKLLRLKITDHNPPIQGACLDVSASGMKIKLHSRKTFNSSKEMNLEVAGKTGTYRIGAVLRWSRKTVLDTFIGVHFLNPPLSFLSEVLELEPGSQSLPFQIRLVHSDTDRAEFFTNLKFGGVIIKDDDTHNTPIRPPLNSSVFVLTDLGPIYPEIRFQGTVVAHLPNGFGLNVPDSNKIMDKLRLR
jgi:hypothetical protein